MSLNNPVDVVCFLFVGRKRGYTRQWFKKDDRYKNNFFFHCGIVQNVTLHLLEFSHCVQSRIFIGMKMIMYFKKMQIMNFSATCRLFLLSQKENCRAKGDDNPSPGESFNKARYYE